MYAYNPFGGNKMLTKDTELRLDHAVTDDKIGDEIAARVEVSSSPATTAAADAVLALLDASKDADLTERLFVGLAGDGRQGKEISDKLKLMIPVLEARSANVPADIIAAKAAMGSESMSEDTRFHLEHALGSKAAADEFKASYDAMVAAIQAIDESLEV